MIRALLRLQAHQQAIAKGRRQTMATRTPATTSLHAASLARTGNGTARASQHQSAPPLASAHAPSILSRAANGPPRRAAAHAGGPHAREPAQWATTRGVS